MGFLIYYSSHSSLHSSPVSKEKHSTAAFCFGLQRVYLNSLHQASQCQPQRRERGREEWRLEELFLSYLHSLWRRYDRICLLTWEKMDELIVTNSLFYVTKLRFFTQTQLWFLHIFVNSRPRLHHSTLISYGNRHYDFSSRSARMHVCCSKLLSPIPIMTQPLSLRCYSNK